MRRFLFFTVLSTSAWAADCDRRCLQTLLDQYLTALVQHKPTAAPLSAGFRQTQNAKAERTGTGMWQSANALGKVQRKYYDAVSGQAAFFGIVDEAVGPAIATLRMKVEDRRITEAEWVVNRKGDPGLGPNGGNQANAAYYDPDYLIAHAPVDRVVPKAERLSRADLIAITNSYFDGLSAHDGKLILAHAGCTRLENGVLTTQRPIQGGGVTDCTGEGAMVNIFAVTARRYPLVDEETGTVLALALFQRKPGVALRRNLLAEWFVIEQGRIRSIFASMYYPEPEALVPNWEPYDGNWPVPLPVK